MGLDLYAMLKDLWLYIKMKRVPVQRIVDNDYINTSGIHSKLEREGHIVKGIPKNKLSQFQTEGWKLITEYDDKKRKTYYLETAGGTVYIKKMT